MYPTPEHLLTAIDKQARETVDRASDASLAWHDWADKLAELARTMPRIPDIYRYRDHTGAGREVLVDVDDRRHNMGARLRSVRDQADAYAAEITRTAELVDQHSKAAQTEAGRWVGARYFPIAARGSEEVWFLIVDTAEDRTGYWDGTGSYDYSDGAQIVWFDSYDDAAERADALNAEPEPYPESAQRGRWIVVRSRSGWDVVDRGVNLRDWTVMDSPSSYEQARATADLNEANDDGEEK